MVMNPISSQGFLVKGVMTILYIATFEHGTCGSTVSCGVRLKVFNESTTAWQHFVEMTNFRCEFLLQISAKLRFPSLAQVARGRQMEGLWYPTHRGPFRPIVELVGPCWAPISLQWAKLRSFPSIFVFGQRVVSWRGISECGQIDWSLLNQGITINKY